MTSYVMIRNFWNNSYDFLTAALQASLQQKIQFWKDQFYAF